MFFYPEISCDFLKVILEFIELAIFNTYVQWQCYENTVDTMNLHTVDMT